MNKMNILEQKKNKLTWKNENMRTNQKKKKMTLFWLYFKGDPRNFPVVVSREGDIGDLASNASQLLFGWGRIDRHDPNLPILIFHIAKKRPVHFTDFDEKIGALIDDGVLAEGMKFTFAPATHLFSPFFKTPLAYHYVRPFNHQGTLEIWPSPSVPTCSQCRGKLTPGKTPGQLPPCKCRAKKING